VLDLIKKEPVAIKGNADGVVLVFCQDVPVMELLKITKEKIKNAKGFFVGSFKITVTGRIFTNSDKLRILSVMKTILPEAEVFFKDTENVDENVHN
jgi:hypothetical protein